MILTKGISNTTIIASPKDAIPKETNNAITIRFDFAKSSPSTHPCHRDFQKVVAVLVVTAVVEDRASRLDWSGEEVMKAITIEAPKKDTLSKNITPFNPHNPNNPTPIAGPMRIEMFLLSALRELAEIKYLSDTS